MIRSRCGSCRAENLLTFLDLGSSPLADAFPASPDEHQERYPLRLAVCEACWLVQLLDVVPDADLYNDHYGFYAGASPSSIAYFADYAAWVLERYGDRVEKGLTVEIASNDGVLLRHFHDRGRAVGVEPAANVAQVALDAGMDVIVKPFSRAVAAEIIAESGYADLIIANNVVAHVSDLDDFLGGIDTLLRSDGVAIIEVQYVADLLAGNQFDHVYHEHRFYYSLTSLASALARHGLSIVSHIETPAQGGSIRVVVEHGSLRAVVPGEAWLLRHSAYGGVQGRVERLRDRLLSLIRGEREAGRKVAGYAASAKSTTLLNFCKIGPDLLSHILDVTPYKIGRYAPGTGIPIVGESDADTFVLMAWNYLPGVLRRERSFIDRGGRFIVPIPQPVLL